MDRLSSRLLSRTCHGLKSYPVLVQVTVYEGGTDFLKVNGFSLRAAVDCEQRVRSALRNCGYPLPKGSVLVSLLGEVRDTERHYDFPIALALLHAAKVIPEGALNGWEHQEFYGELSASGELKTVDGLLPAARDATAAGHCIFVPAHNCGQFRLLEAVQMIAVENLEMAVEHLSGRKPLVAIRTAAHVTPQPREVLRLLTWPVPALARDALVASAAGGHSLLLVGPDDHVRRDARIALIELFPTLTVQEAREVVLRFSARGRRLFESSWGQRPVLRVMQILAFAERAELEARRPDLPAQCLEDLELAHQGLLLVDDLGKFDAEVLESLQFEMEANVTKLLTQQWCEYVLLMSMAACPCGNCHDLEKTCKCTAEQIGVYRESLRFGWKQADIRVNLLPYVHPSYLTDAQEEADSRAILQRVAGARTRQLKRNGRLNAYLTAAEIRQHSHLNDAAKQLFGEYVATEKLEPEAQLRVLNLGRTLVDLDDSVPSNSPIDSAHLAKALKLYCLKL